MASTILIRGGDGNRGGYSTRGDSLVNQTADGVSLQEMWGELIDATTAYNEARSVIASLLSYQTTATGDAVLQSVISELFDEATEFGVPMGISEPSYLKLGYNLRDYDKSLRATWRYIRDASAEQIQDRVRRIFEADNRLVTGLVLQRLFSPTPYINDQMLTCYGLWSGDGIAPPAHMGQTFDGDHQHHLATNSTALRPSHFEAMRKHVMHHGYAETQAAQLILFIHPDDVETSGMTAWRAGIEYTAGETPNFDFIVSSSAPAYLTTQHIEGTPPPPEYNSLPVLGSYAGVFVIQSYFVPKGYVALAASGGPNSIDNPVAVRQHANPAYQGLRLIPGNSQYPLVDSFFARAIGVGVRHRGAAVVAQIVASTTYTEPTFVFSK